jgi:adenylosuccinate lyase
MSLCGGHFGCRRGSGTSVAAGISVTGSGRPKSPIVSCVFVSIPNVLAARYASAEMVAIWSPEAKVVAERRLWLAVLRAQAELGVEVPRDAVADYERVLEDVDLASIAARERVLRHDVKARIEEFNALAGHEHVHKGMTSRDLTENVEQLQIRRSLELVFSHGVAVLARLADRAVGYRDLVMAGRSHNVAAQATTLGKRFASAAQETLIALTRLRELIDRYPLRGIKGPMGTAQDMLDLLGGDAAKLAELERTGLPAIPGPRRALRPRPARRRSVVVGPHHPADGRPRTRHRGLRARPGRLVGDAAQDEHPQL